MHWSSCWKRGSCIFHSKITPNPFFKNCAWNRHCKYQSGGGGGERLHSSQILTPWWRWTPSRKSNSWGEEQNKGRDWRDHVPFIRLRSGAGLPGCRHTLPSQPASHRDLITAALTSANRLWNMERNTARPCPCEAVGGAGTKLQLLASSRKVLPSRRPLLLAGYASDSPHPNLGPYTLKKFPWWAF